MLFCSFAASALILSAVCGLLDIDCFWNIANLYRIYISSSFCSLLKANLDTSSNALSTPILSFAEVSKYVKFPFCWQKSLIFCSET